MRTFSCMRFVAPCVLALAGLYSGSVSGQWNVAIPDSELLEPWIQTRTLILSLAGDANAFDSGQRSAVGRNLGTLEQALASLRKQFEEAAVGIAGRPEYGYSAREASGQMAEEIAAVGRHLEAAVAAAGISQRADVLATRSSIGALQKSLAAGAAYERDVLQALGSGSRNAIQALAVRWWEAGTKVKALEQAVGELRRTLVDAQSGLRRPETAAGHLHRPDLCLT